MWTCSQCNANVDDENSLCNACGAPRKLMQPHGQSHFSSVGQLREVFPASGLRHDLACVIVRGIGLYLIFHALMSLPSVIAAITADSDLNRTGTSITRGNFTSILIAEVLSTFIAFAGGLFLVFTDVMIRLLARPARY